MTKQEWPPSWPCCTPARTAALSVAVDTTGGKEHLEATRAKPGMV